MNHKLSIIIPCYNCASTLEEAVASVYTQNFTTPFEIIMIDDGSSDNTRDLIIKLSKKYPHTIYHFHEYNRGGGAARNTGISKASGDLIYCLDSDNIFAPDTMQKMINYLDKKKADGVAFSERRFFIGTNKNKYKAETYPVNQDSVQLEDILLPKNILLDNFLYTKKAYNEAGGYPENHGFDTQCFEIRFLATGHSVFFCKDTIFYHRQAGDTKSYFERVYEAGNFSKNMYLIYEEILFLFSKEIKEKILQFDIFKNSALSKESLPGILHQHKTSPLFIEDYKKYLKPGGFEDYQRDHVGNTGVGVLFSNGIYHQRVGQYDESYRAYTELLKQGVGSILLHYNIMRLNTALEPQNKKEDIEKRVDALITAMQTKKQKINLKPNFFIKTGSKIKKIIKHYGNLYNTKN